MLPFLYLIIDVVIVLTYIAGPWIILAKLDFAWPDWLKDGIIVVIVFVMIIVEDFDEVDRQSRGLTNHVIDAFKLSWAQYDPFGRKEIEWRYVRFADRLRAAGVEVAAHRGLFVIRVV